MAKKRSEGTEVTLDLTPMIDVVFLMIIFFMIVTDLTQQDLADITLPQANNAIEDRMVEGRMVINILGTVGNDPSTNGVVEIKRETLGSLDPAYDPDWAATVETLRNYLRFEVLKGEVVDGISERPLLIRADRTTDFKHIQKIMRLCGEAGIRIYKIELAAAENEQ